MKKILSIIAGITVSLCAVSAFAQESNIDVLTNYVNVEIDSEAKAVRNFLNDGTTYIALRDVSELLGCEVAWDDATKTAVITTGKNSSGEKSEPQELAAASEESIAVLENYVNVTIDGKAKAVRNFLYIAEETTYIALRDVSELLNCVVDWDDTTKTAIIITEPAITVEGIEVSAAQFAQLYNTVDAYYGDGITVGEKLDLVKTELVTQAVVDAKIAEFETCDIREAEAEVKMELGMMDAQFGAEAVDQSLMYNGYTRESYIEDSVRRIMNNSLLEYMVENFPEYKEIEDGAEAYYNANKNDYKEHSVQVKHILIPTSNENGEALSETEQKAALKKAQELAKKATSRNFDKLISENNNDPGQPEDGYLVRGNGEFVPEFEAAALALKKGEVSEPVKTAYGYHIILATQVNEYVPYDLFLNEYLAEKWGELDMEFINKWAAEAEVTYNDKVIDAIIQ